MITIACIISSAGTKRNIPVLRKCIASIKTAAFHQVKVNIVVTTNNSSHVINKSKLHIDILVKSPSEAGFVGINNNAVKKTIYANSDYHLIINDDAWINKNFFKNLLDLQSKNITCSDIIVPLIYEANSKELDSFGVEYFKTGYSKNAIRRNIPTTLASMSCLLIRTSFLKKMINKYGYFLNPSLLWYLDDVEFSIRARGIGGIFIKSDKLVAYHMRTYTWGRKSFFVMYQSFRNSLWTIYITWPMADIVKNIFRLLIWQCAVAFYCFLKYSPFMYGKILLDTLKHLRTLVWYRKNTIKRYSKTFVFSTIFSSIEIRYNNIVF